ncbi:MAG: glycosyltransferase family 87 protein [Caulobacteraceae bacterium]|nr:glycosyltransferase family 87 protein [Caulobacteraceae bacterium]
MGSFLIGLRQGDWLTLERVKRLAIVFAALSFTVLCLDAWAHTRFGVVNAGGEQLGRDFVNYWSGARLALHGNAGLAYRINDFLAYERSLTAPNAEFKWYGYPPVAMVLAAPFGALPFIPAFALWTVTGWGVLAGMLTRRLGAAFAVIAVLGAPAFMLNAMSGQNGAFSAALLAGGVLLLDRRPLLSGVLFGLLCYKPHMGVLIPVALIAGGRWKATAAASAAVIGVVCASVLLVGWQPWVAFLHNAPFHRQILEGQPGIWFRMPSLYLAGRLIGAPSGLAYAAQALSALGAAAVVIAIWRGGASTTLKGAGLMVATFLATPYVWDYDMVVLLFAAIWVWMEAEQGRWPPWEKSALAVVVAAPVILPIFSTFAHLQFGPLVLWCMLALILRRARPELFEGHGPPLIPGSLVNDR